jgi:hypothetical protein
MASDRDLNCSLIGQKQPNESKSEQFAHAIMGVSVNKGLTCYFFHRCSNKSNKDALKELFEVNLGKCVKILLVHILHDILNCRVKVALYQMLSFPWQFPAKH